jgi:AraC-like DNA-binding protein
MNVLNGREFDKPGFWSAEQFPPAPYPRYRERIRGVHADEGPIVKGRYEDILLRPGLLILIRDVVTLDDVEAQKEVGPAIHLGLMLEGGGHSSLKGTTRTYPFPANQVSMLATSKTVNGEFFIPAGTVVRYVDIRIEHDFLQEILRETAILDGDGCLDHPELEAEGVRMNLMPMSANIRRVTEQTLACPAKTGCDRLFLEGKVLELLSLALSEQDQRSTDGSKSSQMTLSARDRRRLHAARDLLVADLERTWLLRDLARHVGLNENKLKYGFRQIFGNSVYAYLQDRRMQAAAEMLARGDQSVTSIALAVGYANPAHFSKIFRRYFSVSPSHYARHMPALNSE